jgi:hypothetical protein
VSAERTEPFPATDDLAIRTEDEDAIRHHECLSNVVGNEKRCGRPDEFGELLTEAVSSWRI